MSYKCNICYNTLYNTSTIPEGSFYSFIICNECGTHNDIYDYPIKTHKETKRINKYMELFCKLHNIQSIKQKPKKLFLDLSLHIELMDYNLIIPISTSVISKESKDTNNTLDQGHLEYFTFFNQFSW